MAKTRTELSKKNPYYIPKHRYLELYHFCLQYKDWKRAVSAINSNLYPENFPQEIFQKSKSEHSDPTALYGRYFAIYTKNIELVERVAAATDAELKNYILAAVTMGRSFKYLDGVMHIPCGKDMYYDRYRRFFYLLSREKTY